MNVLFSYLKIPLGLKNDFRMIIHLKVFDDKFKMYPNITVTIKTLKCITLKINECTVFNYACVMMYHYDVT